MEVKLGDRVVVMCECRLRRRDCLLEKGKREDGFKGCDRGVVVAQGWLERFVLVRMEHGRMCPIDRAGEIVRVISRKGKLWK
jgi:hypothetical protein